jgi:small subunit ribosomal protein S17
METTSSVGHQRKRLTGEVISDKMDKTVVVVVTNTRRHPLYGKVIRVSKNYKAHDENNVCKVGDRVQIVESRPYSKDTHFRVEMVLTSTVQIDRSPLQAAEQAEG